MERNLIAREIDDLAMLRQYDQPPTKGVINAKATTTIFSKKPLNENKLVINGLELKAVSELTNWSKGTVNTNPSKSRMRDSQKIKLLVLHETGTPIESESIAPGISLERGNTSHMAVLRNGSISQFNDVVQLENHIFGFNNRAIGIEFVNRGFLSSNKKPECKKVESNDCHKCTYEWGWEGIPSFENDVIQKGKIIYKGLTPCQKSKFPEGKDYLYCFWGNGFNIYRIPPSIGQLEKLVELVKFLVVSLPAAINKFKAGNVFDKVNAQIVIGDWLSIGQDKVTETLVDKLVSIENNWPQLVSYNQVKDVWRFTESDIPEAKESENKNLFIFTPGYDFLTEEYLNSQSGVFAHNAAKDNHADGGFLSLYVWLRVERGFDSAKAYGLTQKLMKSHYIKVHTKKKYTQLLGQKKGEKRRVAKVIAADTPVVLIDVSDATLNHL